MLRSGFTLIELLIVMTVVVALTGAVLPYVQEYLEDSRIGRAKSDLNEISRILVLYESRERTYLASDVSQLTGRYLTRAPIDPWGSPYLVSTSSGIIFSIGPDKLERTSDDIKSSYQPPLALLGASWEDSNQSGNVDSVGVSDRLWLTFSRKLRNIPGPSDIFIITSSGVADVSTVLDLPGGKVLSTSQTVILSLLPIPNSPFVPGKDTVFVSKNNNLFDLANPPNRCIGSQGVLIKAK